MSISSEMSRNDAGEASGMEWVAPTVCVASDEVYIEYVSISNSLAVDMIRVAISPLGIVSLLQL